MNRRILTIATAGLAAVLIAIVAVRNRQTAGVPSPAPPAHQAPAAVAITVPPGSAAVEQTAQGTKPPPAIVASFDGLGGGFKGPQGTAPLRNPSDNSLAVGPDDIVQIVNARMAIYTKKGRKYATTGRVLYGPVPTNNVFRGFGGDCGARDNGDAVVRYDQLAGRWLIVMPIFRLLPPLPDEPPKPKAGEPAQYSLPGVKGQPGPAVALYQPPPPPPGAVAERRRGPRPAAGTPGHYAMCYAVSTSSNPLGSYYRYEFIRPLFPDYPRPAVWPDGYYVPTSTGDTVVQKQACVVERAKMLKGEPAREECVIIDGVNFLNNADLEGKALPPPGTPNVMLAAGGTQLKHVFESHDLYAWLFHVNWRDPARTTLDGPMKIPVAPYHYLCNGQLSSCVPQPGTNVRLDSQGDKLMARVVYRRIGNRQMIVAVHSVNTAEGAGGVRWYELRLDAHDHLTLDQQGTYAPDHFYRWMGSPAIDAKGDIGIGYSFGGTPDFAGQRFAGRLAGDPKGLLTLHEAVLATGEASQTSTLRWEDYSQTAVDPSDDCTIWYVGDYYQKGATSYSTRIGAFRMPGCDARH